MTYDIRLLINHSISEKLYFFDANLWIKILRPQTPPSKRDQKYLDFFQKFKNHPHHPKIAITSLVLSEVINRLLREVGYQKYITEQKIDKSTIQKDYYKRVYRQTKHFAALYESICDDIWGYENFYVLLDDELGDLITSDQILSPPPKGLDFNDRYYFLLAKHKKIPIVTDDADFFVEGVTILTLNDNLYQRGKDSIVPKIN